MSLTREQMISMLSSELARRKRMDALPQSLTNIKADEAKTSAASPDWKENLAAGLASGVNRGARGAMNLLTKHPKFGATQSDLWSDETLKELDKTNADLEGTGAGFAGSLIGSMGVTAPVSAGGSGTVARGCRLIKALASPTTRAMVEGGISSAIMADPDKQGEAAAEGAAWGLGMNRAGKLLKKAVGGLVEKGADAFDLQSIGKSESKDIFVPLAQATHRGPNEPKAPFLTRAISGMYKGLLPYFPGTTGQIERQAAKVGTDVEEILIKQVDKALDPAGKGTLRPDVLKEPQRAVKELGDMITHNYNNTVKSYAFAIPSDMEQQVRARIQAKRPDVPDAILDDYTEEFMGVLNRYTKNGVITGKNLMDVKNLFGKKPRDLAPTVNDKAMVDDLHDMFDDLVEDQLRQGNKASNLEDLATYKRTRDAWKKYTTLRDAVESSKSQREGGHFTPGTMVDKAGPNLDQRQLGQAAHAVTSKPAISVTAEGRNVGRMAGVLGTGIGVGTGAGIPTLAVLGASTAAANVAATETAQRLLLGDHKTQRFIINALRQDPELARDVGFILRNAMTTKQGSDYRGEE